MTFEVGLCLRSFDVGPREAALTASLAEKLGFTSFWMTEEMGRGSPPALSMSAAETSRLTLGTAIISIYSRTPMTTAMEAITLRRLPATGLSSAWGLEVPASPPEGMGHLRRGLSSGWRNT